MRRTWLVGLANRYDAPWPRTANLQEAGVAWLVYGHFEKACGWAEFFAMPSEQQSSPRLGYFKLSNYQVLVIFTESPDNLEALCL
jgi:hypothetical protein